MSYSLRIPRKVSRQTLLPQQAQPSAPFPPMYPLHHVGTLPDDIPLTPLPDQKSERDKAIKIIIALVLLVGFLMWLNSRKKAVNENRSRERSRASKRSTAQMAKDLYGRLEKRGGVNENVMRSLAQLSRNA